LPSIHVAVCFSIRTTVIGAARVAVVIGGPLVQAHGVLVEIDLACRLRFVRGESVTVGDRSVLVGEFVGRVGTFGVVPLLRSRSEHGPDIAGIDAGANADTDFTIISPRASTITTTATDFEVDGATTAARASIVAERIHNQATNGFPSVHLDCLLRVCRVRY
jgi:hypothetical protein